MSATGQLSRRGEGLVVLLVGCACLLVPRLARQRLGEKVGVSLAARASDALGLPVTLGDASLGLTGTLEIADVRVGSAFYARRVVASLGPSAAAASGLAANELWVDSPHLDIHVGIDGSTNLDALMAQRDSRKSDIDSKAGKVPSRYSISRLHTIRFSNGSMNLELDHWGSLTSSGIQLWIHDGKAHAVFGPSHVKVENQQGVARGTMPRAALDYRSGEGMWRFLADGGALSIQSSKGRALLREIVVATGIEDHAWHLSATTGVNRADGKLDAVFSSMEDGVRRLSIKADKAPLALLGRWLPESWDIRKTRISGGLSVLANTKSRDFVRVTADKIDLRGLKIRHEVLARNLIELNLRVFGKLELTRSKQGVLLDATAESIESGALKARVSVSAQWPPDALQKQVEIPDNARISLRLFPVACDAALSSLPPALRPSLAGLDLRGTMHSSLDLMLSRLAIYDTRLQVDSGIVGCEVTREPPAADASAVLGKYEYHSPDGRTRILDQEDESFARYESLPKYVPLAFVAAEDALFFSHSGFDTHQIERSLAIDMQNSKLLRGGSTISQQVVKNLFLHRRRSLARKLQEAILTWRLEQIVSKKRILEIYLNIIELGDLGTFGITEAARRWFDIPARDLTILQTAFLAALTPEPTSMSARIRAAGALDPVSAGRVATILRAMLRSKVISLEQYRAARASTLRLQSQ